ncbi:nucleoside recognition domain-containing protein [Chitinispirillales bacterium ANBcel5]|uniref:nucleoside recognition domain-containing protein n=1 Tax=Cellulosispirillum alkaliphilum TaxID=3039283 RepID=UPI002A520B7F|nr:nucleoside recognition domain-containing protein [Chitinispirillales bacterium ANBcel5]
MDELTSASFESANSAVTLAIGLIGAMALWLGIMKIAETAGLLKVIARAIRPLMVRLFPDVPAEHPAMSAIIMNMAANMLGLGNAATPMGIKAMTELDKLNPQKDTASNAMCLFLAINTSSVTILPLGVISVRAAAGATTPASILLPAIMATFCSTLTAVVVSKLLSKRSPNPAQISDSLKNKDNFEEMLKEEKKESDLTPPGLVGKIFAYCTIGVFALSVPFLIRQSGQLPTFNLDLITSATGWLVPIIMGGLLILGYLKGVKIYEVLTNGAKEGFQVAIRIIPFMVAIFVAIGMFRASGALELFTRTLRPLTRLVGMPAEVLPMALIRPLSGTGAFGYMAEIVNNAPDSFSAFFSSIAQGSTETTFYVLAVYFGSIGIRKTRHALPAALTADAVGIASALFFAHLFFRI